MAWACVDGAIAAYLAVYGANVVSSALLAIGVLAVVLAAVFAQREDASVNGPLLLLLVVHVAIRTIVPFRAEAPYPPGAMAGLAGIATLASAIAVIVWHRSGDKRAAIALLLLVASLGLAGRILIITLDITPPFDVLLIQKAAGTALLEGTDPYLTHVYASGYPYLPMAAVGAMLGTLAGDARWAVVAGDAMTAAGLLLLGHRIRVPLAISLTAAALWLWSWGGLYVAWQGFPEPMLTGFAALGAAFLAGPRPRRTAAGILLGLAVGVKQFGVGFLPFLLQWKAGRPSLAVAVVTASLVILPFAAWHPEEFLTGTFWSLLHVPGRSYALNLLVWPSGMISVPLALSLPLALVCGWWAWWRFGGAFGGWLAGSAMLLMVAFALNRIAFPNYYVIPLLALLLLIVSRSGGISHDVGPTAERTDRAAG